MYNSNKDKDNLIQPSAEIARFLAIVDEAAKRVETLYPSLKKTVEGSNQIPMSNFFKSSFSITNPTPQQLVQPDADAIRDKIDAAFIEAGIDSSIFNVVENPSNSSQLDGSSADAIRDKVDTAFIEAGMGSPASNVEELLAQINQLY